MACPAEAIIGTYQRHARAWDRARSRALDERRWLDKFADLLPQGAQILDIGCGGGEPLARHLIERGYRLAGIDASPPLIETCRDRFPDHDWHVADMRELALGRQFDGLLAWDSFFHLAPADQRRMFPIFRGHAAPGAALLFTSGPAHGEAIGSFEGEPLYHGSLDPDEYRDLLARSGFTVVAHQVEDPECGHHTLWLARMQAVAISAPAH
ncbi:MAG TPA: methyltransferase domain-containing protein [Allosphingosinicella sp.]|jgi:2-polyprenyl-3-methyl-5-hydroxy-6-metoxy-1,4-benzoquinol methylase